MGRSSSRSVRAGAPDAVASACAALRAHGAVLVRGALAREWVAALREAADARYRRVEELAPRATSGAQPRELPGGWRFVPTASSLSLGALDEPHGLPVACALAATSPLRAILVALHEGPFAIDLDQAWLRRQHAPAHAPRWHAPHAWHQDGALGHDFALGADAPGALLPMVTCWAPLGPCGADAPGLEVLAPPLDRLVPPAELGPDAVPGARSWTPRMAAGDVLLVHGGALHRTHVTPAMTRERTSVELRSFPAARLPARLARDRFSAPIA